MVRVDDKAFSGRESCLEIVVLSKHDEQMSKSQGGHVYTGEDFDISNPHESHLADLVVNN